MNTGTYAGETVLQCPDHGILLKQKILTTLLDRLAPEFASFIDINSSIKAVPDKSPINRCPSCGHKTDHYGYMEANIAMVDFCTSCHLIWVDTDELQAMAKMYVQFHKIKPSIDQK